MLRQSSESLFLSIRTRTVLVLVAVSVLSIVAVAGMSYFAGVRTIEDESFAKLTAVRELKAEAVESYFATIRDQIITMSENEMIIGAMHDFQDTVDSISAELALPEEEWIRRDLALRQYYESEFLPRLGENTSTDPGLDEFWPGGRAQVLQQEYISENPFPTGEKDLFDGTNDTSYGVTHQRYHPLLRRFLQRFGYYDVFLVDSNTGRIVYSVFKEVDFGTSLLSGPYSDTNIAQVFRDTRDAKRTDVAELVDFEPYAPSYGAPASFIASPVFDGEDQIGVLIFQMPVDRIDSILTSDERWASVGLGETGEAYVVGPDYRLRTQSRFLIEDRDGYLKTLERTDLPPETLQAIASLGSAIGLQTVRTDGAEVALNGTAGVGRFVDYRGVEVFSAYKPLDIEGLEWALMSEVDADEAFQPMRSVRNRLIVWLGVLVATVIGIAMLFGRAITRPLAQLSEQASRVESGDLESPIQVRSHDEIGELAGSLESMRQSLAELVRRQDKAIEALSTPLIPVQNDIFVMPLVGELDDKRIAKIRTTLIDGLHDEQAKAVIIDLTGLPELDEDAAVELTRAVSAAKLLGVTTVITGMQADTAKRLAESDIPLHDVATRRTLEDGIRAATRAIQN